MKICYFYCCTALLFVLTVSLCTPVVLVYIKTHSFTLRSIKWECRMTASQFDLEHFYFSRQLSKNSFFIATTTEVNSVADSMVLKIFGGAETNQIKNAGLNVIVKYPFKK